TARLLLTDAHQPAGLFAHQQTCASTIEGRSKYEPFGQRRRPDDLTVPQPVASGAVRHGYTGHEHDDELRLINMRGRMYDPQLGRFLSPDPFVQAPLFGQSFNRYSYVFNNPLRYTDPSGFVAMDRVTYYDSWYGGYVSRDFAGGTPASLRSPDISLGGGLFEFLSEMYDVSFVIVREPAREAIVSGGGGEGAVREEFCSP
ncbi:RHS repeat-associated core domain-containing protein, partial [Myxococcus sp. RHSTA-1-4]|uniref:RHS repeat-associated core domain-containing protein n=1 Tax=Myxococcus sp. RHSTA-1-4 TaxID=2874601 RepID=UPI001CBBC73B